MSEPIQDPRRQRLIGIALMCSACAVFAVLDCTAKYLGGHMDTVQVVAMRFVTAFLVALLISNPFTRPGLLRTARPGLQVFRGLVLVSTTTCNFFSFRYLQLDEAMAILFSTPFLVAIMAGPILGEWVGWRRWLAIGVGFAGVLVVIRPGFGGMHWAALLSVMAAALYALYSIVTRLVMRHDSSETTLFYANLVGISLALPVLPFVWTMPSSWLDLFLLLAVGACGSFGHYLLIVAHHRAPASVLSPFIYTQLVWAVTLGYLVFANVPTGWTLLGSAIVVGSGLYLLNRERKASRTVAPPGRG